MTGKLLNYIKFLKLRIHEGAQYEAQVVAKAMYDILEELFPETFSCLDFTNS
jgi:thymidylate synthase ThyX